MVEAEVRALAGVGDELGLGRAAGDGAWFGAPRVRRRFGPVEVERLGGSVLFELLDANLRLLWEEGAPTPSTGAPAPPVDVPPPGAYLPPPVGRRLALLLRAEAGGELERPEAIRAPARRRLADPVPAHPEVVRSLRVDRSVTGVRVTVETTVTGAAPVTVVLAVEQAADLADLLATWR
ncbi:hypothetical protein [Pseudofrankia sp. BMG5.37]|uniref:hypothetical protein n=1 Tax=Pseudofrankia sp. BMG5.37 TaxID=3050035 RepID=UPI002895E019|nr:hypothetical protein [Pseudofrankia sp. BMG5.37]MDT3440462.1 hypothetical protein [Pseudofrankia sp. BMG5.37]